MIPSIQGNNHALQISQNPYKPEEKFEVNKNLFCLFNNIKKLTDFIDKSSLDKINTFFKTKNINEVKEVIEFLIHEYLKNKHAVDFTNWLKCITAIKSKFSNSDLTSLNNFDEKIRNVILEGILSNYKSPFLGKSLIIGIAASINISFENFDRMHMTSMNDKSQRSNLRNKVMTLIQKEKTLSKNLKVYCEQLFKFQKYVNCENLKSQVVNGKLCYQIPNNLVPLYKNISCIELISKHNNNYVTLKSLNADNIVLLKNLKEKRGKGPQYQTIIKQMIASLKKDQLLKNIHNIPLQDLEYEREDSHNKIFPLLYNNYSLFKNSFEKVKNNPDEIKNEIKLLDLFNREISKRKYQKPILNRLAQHQYLELKKIESDEIPASEAANWVSNLQKEGNKFNVQLDLNYLKDLAQYQEFIRRPPADRCRSILHKKSDECQALKQLANILVKENDVFNKLQKILNSAGGGTVGETINKKYQNIMLKDIVCLSNETKIHASSTECSYNALLLLLMIAKTKKISTKISTKKPISNYKFNRIVNEFADMLDIGRQQYKHQKLTYEFVCEKLRTEHKQNHNNGVPYADREAKKYKYPTPVIEKKDERKIIFNLQNKINSMKMSAPVERNNPSKSATMNQPKKIVPVKTKSVDEKPNIPTKSLKLKQKNLGKPEAPHKKIKPTFFNTVGQAVQWDSKGLQLVPLDLLQKKERPLCYIASEFRQLPGEEPSWFGSHHRVSKWSDAELPLSRELFPRYQVGRDLKEINENQAIQLFNHLIPRMAHRFIESLGFKEKSKVTLVDSSNKEKRTKFTAIARLSNLEKNDDGSYEVAGTSTEGFYAIEIRDNILFHDAFSTHSEVKGLAKSEKLISPEVFENKTDIVKVYLKNNKINRVCIDDKSLMKRIEIFRTKKVK